MIDINELRQLAQVATPGPWLLRTVPTSAGLCHIISAADWRGAFIYGDGLRIGVDDSLPKAQELAANAHLIAAANPAVISELLDRLEAAEADALEQARLNGMGASREAALLAKLEAAEKERDALRAKIEATERQKPVAWRTFDGEGGYDYRSYEDNENYKLGWDARNPNHIGWVEPLYALPGAKGEEK